MPDLSDSEIDSLLASSPTRSKPMSDGEIDSLLASTPSVVRDPNLAATAALRKESQPALAATQEGAIYPAGEFTENALKAPFRFAAGGVRGVLAGFSEAGAETAKAIERPVVGQPPLSQAPSDMAKAILGEKYRAQGVANRPYQIGADVGRKLTSLVTAPITIPAAITQGVREGNITGAVMNQVAGMLPFAGSSIAYKKALDDPNLSDEERTKLHDRFWGVDLPSDLATLPFLVGAGKHIVDSIRTKYMKTPGLSPEARQPTIAALDEAQAKIEAAKPVPEANTPELTKLAEPMPPQKPIWQMAPDELAIVEAESRGRDAQDLLDLFGPEGAKRYRNLERTANSTTKPHDITSTAYDEIEKMSASLTDAQKNRLYGIGDTRPQLDEIKEYRKSLAGLDWSSPSALGDSLKWAISRLGEQTDPSKMTDSERLAFATLRHGFEGATEQGWNPEDVYRSAIRGAAARFSDPQDATFILRRFLKPEATKPPASELGSEAIITNELKSDKLPPSAPSTPVQQKSDLEAVRDILTKPPPKGPRTSVISRTRAALEGEMVHLDNTDATLRKMGGLGRPDVTMGKRAELALYGAASKATADIHDAVQAITKPLAPTKDVKNLEVYLYTERVKARLADDPTVKHVEGWTSERANSAQKQLLSDVGPGRYDKIKEVAHGAYQEAMDKALRLQVESGNMSQKMYDYIKRRNPFYAPFKVLRYLGEEGPKGQDLGRRIATVADYTEAIKGIHKEDFGVRILDPSMNHILRSRVLAEKNRFMTSMANTWIPMDKDGAFIKKLGPNERPPDGFEKVKYLENGKEVELAVRQNIAKSVQGMNKAQLGLSARFLLGASGPMKWGTVGANLGYQVVNLGLRDMPRMALISKAGFTGPIDAARMIPDIIIGAFDAGMANLFNRMTPRYRAMLQSGAGGSSISGTLFGNRTTRSLTPPEGMSSKAWAFVNKHTFYRIADLGKAVEETTKMTAFNRLTRKGVMSQDAIASEVRNFGGSPDFPRHGWMMPELNPVQMFLNSNVQGLAADVGRMSGMRDGGKAAAQVWARMAVPSAVIAMNMMNNLSPENEEDFNGISDWEKKNYLIFLYPKDAPNAYITNDKGVRVRNHWNFQKSDVLGAVFDTVEQGVRLAHDKDPKAFGDFALQLAQDVSPINLQHPLGGLNPVLKSPIELATGKDLWTGQDLVNPRLQGIDEAFQASARTPEVFKQIGEKWNISPDIMYHVAKTSFGSGPMSIFPQKPLEGQPDILGVPVIGQAVGRFMARGGQDFTKFYNAYKDAAKAKDTMDYLMARSPGAAKAYVQANMDRIKSYYALKPMADLLALETKTGRTAQEQGRPPIPMPNLQPKAAKAAAGAP